MIRDDYEVVLADPPWLYPGSAGTMGAAENHYSCLEISELKKLDVSSICAKEAVCFMWATCPKLDYAIDCLRSWGFHYVGVAFVWVKTSKTGKILSGIGVRPSVTKPTTELLLVGVKHKRGRPFKVLNEGMGQVVLHERLGHSVKPELFHEKIVELFGDKRRLELFARRRVAGWDCVGNELDGVDVREYVPSSRRCESVLGC